MPTVSPVLTDVVRLLVRHPLRWLVPALCVAVGGAFVAARKADVWEASLALIVRAEAGGNVGGGRFRDLSEMKTLQETVLEVAKNRAVLAAALAVVGPPAGRVSTPGAAWPAPTDVDDLADAVKLAPPKGAEFGSTEVFYLKVKDASSERAVRSADALAEQVLVRFRKLRDEKARSMVAELEEAAALSRAEADDAVARLKVFESGVGGDLGELRNLEQQGAGTSDLRQLILSLETEVRAAESSRRNLRELADLLHAADADPTKLLATPNRLLESQPSLRKLKEGLIDAQLRSSQLLGNMSREHPSVRAALEAEAEVRSRLHRELAAAAEGVQAETAAVDDMLAERRRQHAEARTRLDRLAGLRAEYSALNAEAQHRLRQSEQADKQLVDARAAQAGAVAASLLSRIDSPDAGTRPLGPSKKLLAAGSVLGGLLFGLGVLLLTSRLPLEPVPAEVADVAATQADLLLARRMVAASHVPELPATPAA